jgi:dipeptidase E
VATERHIVGLGGGGDTEEQTLLLYDYALGLTGKPRPKVLYVPTAIGDSTYPAEGVIRFYDTFRGRGELSHLFTFPWPPADLRGLILSQDSICVSGGSTANMLAIWKTHGIDELMREAWERGIVLWGASAGMICWFESGVTDSFGPQLESMECLGFLAGSACPHYHGEERRRPRYRELVDAGLAEGLAADDGVGLHFVGTELHEVVTCDSTRAAYRVTAAGEERLEPRLLS